MTPVRNELGEYRDTTAAPAQPDVTVAWRMIISSACRGWPLVSTDVDRDVMADRHCCQRADSANSAAISLTATREPIPTVR